MAAFVPVVIVAPFSLLALFLVWLAVRLVWDIPYWWFAGGYVAAAVLLFWRPLQAAVLTPLLGARRPTADELEVLVPVWEAVAQANHLPADRYVLRVLPSDELNAFACGGHLVVVTSFALDELPTRELTGVLAHELSHHLGFHTVALTLDHWLSLPVVAMARFGFWLRNVATAATDTFARDSAGLTFIGTVVAGGLRVLSFPFYAGLLAADALGNVVAHRAELQADQRVVRMGYGRHLAAALRRVTAMGGRRRVRLAGPAGGLASAGPHPGGPHRGAVATSRHRRRGAARPSGPHRHPAGAARPELAPSDQAVTSCSATTASSTVTRSSGANPTSSPRRPPLT